MTTEQTLTTRDVAAKLGTDPRTLRRFLRASSQGVGTGSRYAVSASDVPALKKAFATWIKAEGTKIGPA